MITKDDVLQELEQEALATRRTLEHVPQDQLLWKPHERSMTLGQLALHIAVIPGAIAELASNSEFDANTQIPRPNPANIAELMAAYDLSLEKARTILGAMDDATLASPWKIMNGDREVMSMPRVALLRSIMLNHWYHHRGQLTVYLRQVGARVPALYGASADENPFDAETR